MIVTVMFFPWRVLFSNQLQTLALSGIMLTLWWGFWNPDLLAVLLVFLGDWLFSKHYKCMHTSGLLYILKNARI